MVVEPRQREREERQHSLGSDGDVVAAFAEAAQALRDADALDEILAAMGRAAARAARAEIVVVRVVEPGNRVRARAVFTPSAVLAAELEGSQYALEELPGDEETELERLPATVRRAAARAGAEAVLAVTAALGETPLGALELMRPARPFEASERVVARVVAAQVALAIRAWSGATADGAAADGRRALERAGEALVAGVDEARTAEAVTRLAAEATGALTAILWRRGDAGRLELVAAAALPDGASGVEEAAAAASRALQGRRPVAIEDALRGLPRGAAASTTLQLGQPPLGALQLLFPTGGTPEGPLLATLATFGVRAAHALRATERARTVAVELERTRALLAVVGEAIAHLSLAHTLETAVERVGELFDADRIAVYLRDERRLTAAAGIGLAGPHVRVAERLLDLALGPFRGRGTLVVDDAATDPRLAGVRDAVAESGLDAAVAVPLLVRDDAIGLLAVYPPSGRVLTANEASLLAALATQLAVAVQNAQLHERATQLGAEREAALGAERQSARRLTALYEISRSFAQSLSLDATLDAVTRTVVELLGVDAAVVRMPDARGTGLVSLATHVRDDRVEEAVKAILARPQSLARLPGRRLFRMGKPLVLEASTAGSLGASYELLVPFLEKGSTAAVVPVATPAEVLATLTLLSLDPGNPIDEETVSAALAVAGQAALAIDNARLYQQQKDFADTMQRSLLPSGVPQVEGLEVGAVYASSARVEVGGDLYDYLTLDDGRLAVVLGDVTGHGIDATADMAMAKFVFRSVVREHPEPGDFLAAVNSVVVTEVAPGKFVTMAYVVVDAAAGEVACGLAGHPQARLVSQAGRVMPLGDSGLALGIEPDQTYVETRERFEPGATVVLFTDGVIEARRGGELYGIERLDELLVRHRDAGADELAQEVLGACRAFAGGELADDCAIVVIKRTAAPS